ncbi:MAG: hypothetical protein AAF752_15155, partial [Bacteroidota bacterium]
MLSDPNRPLPDDPSLDELRELIFGSEQFALHARYTALLKQHAALKRKVIALEEQVSNPSRRAADDSEVLAEAILLRQQSDHLDPSSLHLDEALQPVVEGALRRAVDEDPEGIAESIYPSLMPAVRRAISQSFERLRQQITRALDERFSARSLNWRWQAIRTGQSFG